MSGIDVDLAVNGLITGVFYALMAIGLSLIFGILKIVNFAHGEFYMVGAYAYTLIALALGVPVWLALPFAFAVGALLGWLTERTLMRPLYAGYTSWGLMRDEYAVIVTFGLSLFLINFVDKVIGLYAYRGPPLVETSRVVLGPVLISGHRLLAAGIAIAEFPYAGAIFKPMLFYVFSIPKSIFLPMFILIFGIGFQQKVAYAAFTTALVVLMSATAAVESVKSDYVLVARSFGATPLQILRRVYVPSMMPVLLETLRISMIFNFTGVMIAEMYASRTGIGHLISNWGENFQMPQLFAGVIILSIVAIAFNETVRYLEARCSTWRT